MATNPYSEITKDILDLSELCKKHNVIDQSLYEKYDVKRGLRDVTGKGVLTGLTDISEVCATRVNEKGESVPCEGSLFYRGVNTKDLVNGFIKEERFGFEETTYLLLFGELPTKEQLENFKKMLAKYRSLPTSFVRDIIMKAPSQDMMNTLARSVLTLYAYDDKADDISVPNVLRQCLQLIALFPCCRFGYQAYSHYHCGNSFFIHVLLPNLSTAENILSILRRTVPILSGSPVCLMLPLFCTQSMVEGTILLSQFTWLHHPELIPIPRSQLRRLMKARGMAELI